MSMWRVLIQQSQVIFKSDFVLNKHTVITKMPFYAVAKGRTAGIFMSWPDCEAQVKGFPGARYKKFDTVEAAQNFVTSEGGSNNLKIKTQQTKTVNEFSSTNNLKRSFSVSTNAAYSNQKKNLPSQSKTKSKAKRNDKTVDHNNSDDNFSDDSDGLSTIIAKQMDDIEKRLKTFEKGVDKIMNKGGKKTILIEPPENKRRKTSNGAEFETDDDGFVQVYTDGACSANGRSGARAGLGVFWGESHPLNISEPVSGRATNNCGEIQAATRSIKQALENGVQKLSINTDSKFLINSVTKWMPGWKRKGWKLASGEPVKNEVDFKDLDSVVNKLQIKWNYVEAHRGIHGNEMADQLAKAGAARYNK